MTGHLELWVLGLLAAVAELVMLSNRLGVPYPVFLVLDNSVLFILIGLQLPNILESISDENSMMSVVLYAALVSLAVIGTRLFWTFPATYLPRYLSRSVRERNPSPPWQQVAAIAYTGMRGAISLAAALAIPLTVNNGAPFPGRDQILFLTFCVILLTLVVQGLSLAGAKAKRNARRPRRGCGRPRRPLRGSRSWRRWTGYSRTRQPGCAISTSTVADASPPATAGNPKAAKRATVTRNAPWRTSVSDGSCWAPSARRSSGSGAKDASAT